MRHWENRVFLLHCILCHARSATGQTLFHPQKKKLSEAALLHRMLRAGLLSSWMYCEIMKLNCYEKVEAVSEGRTVVKVFRSPRRGLRLTKAAIPQSPTQFPPLPERIPGHPGQDITVQTETFTFPLITVMTSWGIWPFRAPCLSFPAWLQTFQGQCLCLELLWIQTVPPGIAHHINIYWPIKFSYFFPLV